MSLFQRLFRRNEERKNTAPPLLEEEESVVEQFQNKFHYSFSDKSLIVTALKHRSYLNISNESRVFSNERLEFLGDAVLDLIVTSFLYKKYPKRTEGQLSKIKAILVSKPVLAETAKTLGLGEMLLMNHGEEKSGGRKRASILADAFEAIIGAIYLEYDLNEADKFVKEHLLSRHKEILKRELYRNYKSILLEHAQANGSKPPEYRVIKESGPDHDKEFEIAVYLNGQKLSEGKGKSKKNAEQEAAKVAIKKLGLESGFKLE
ncbi:MAG: ribonuclease III [Calditrichia bacterium]